MARTSDKSGTYEGIGTGSGRSDSRSDSPVELAAGIGTRISAAAKALDSRKNAAEVMGVSSDTLQRYIRGDNQPTFAAIARLCLASDYSLLWMATNAGPERDSQPLTTSHELSEDHLTIALEFADRAIGTGWLPRPRYARLVRLLYDGVRQGLPTAQIEQFATAAAQSMARGGSGNGGESGLDAAGARRDGGDPTGSAEGGKP